MGVSARVSRHIGSLVGGLLAGIVGLSASYLLAGATAGFVAVPVNALIVDLMPAPILTFSILTLGKLGELIGFVMALALVVVVFGAATLVGRAIADHPFGAVVYAALFTGIFTLVATTTPLPSLGTAVAVGVVVAFLEFEGDDELVDESRRGVLKAAGVVVGFGVVSYIIGSRAHSATASRRNLVESMPWDSERQAEANQEIQRRLEEAASKSLDVRELPSLVSPIEEFYEVDINYLDPQVPPADWELNVTGAVENEFSVTYAELVEMPHEHRFVTLRCVSDPLNGDLIDTALWTGVPVERLFDRANPQGEFVVLRAKDGYYQEFPMDAFENGFLAYGMNGTLLPTDHGAPVRALVLGHWGEVNVKWLTDIEIHESKVIGYWEHRGWHGTGPVHTVAKLRTVNHLGDRTQVAGHAYAGTRGIGGVQVSVDGGDTWAEARLSDPLGDTDAWRQWVYEWSPPTGQHTVVVRAVNEDGTVQPMERQKPHPSGATGWVTQEITV